MAYSSRGKRDVFREGGVTTNFRDLTDCENGGVTTTILSKTGRGLFYLWWFSLESIGNNNLIVPQLTTDNYAVFWDNILLWHDGYALDNTAAKPLTLLAYNVGGLIVGQYWFPNGMAYNDQFSLKIKNSADAWVEVGSRGYFTTL